MKLRSLLTWRPCIIKSIKSGIGSLATACGLVAYAGALLVAVAPVAYLILEHRVSVGWVVLGAVAWGMGVGIKMSSWFYLQEQLKRLSSWNAIVAAGLSGLWSGVTELSAAAGLLLLYSPKSLLEIVAFGIGAGSIEILFLLFVDLSNSSSRSQRLEDLKGRPFGALHPLWFVLERGYAMVFHIATRALTYLSLSQADLLPGLVGLAGFTLLDGAAYYGDELQQWDWFDHHVIGLFHVFGLAVTATTVLAWWALWFLKGYSI
jgi:hypothetical protein